MIKAKSLDERLWELDREIKWRREALDKLVEMRGLIQGMKDKQEAKT